MTAPANSDLELLDNVATALRDGITSGAIPPGTRLDPVQTGEDYGVPTGIAISALAILRREGIIWSQGHKRYAAPAGAPDPETGTRLGALLAQLRDKAGLSPDDLYLRILGDRSWVPGCWPDDIPRTENGEWKQREFWAEADSALGADGSLLKIHDSYYAPPAGKERPQPPPCRPAPSRIPALSRVVSELRARVRAGEWPPGTCLPPAANLARDHRTNTAYIGFALSILGEQGILDPPAPGYRVPAAPGPGEPVLTGVVFQWSDGRTTRAACAADPQRNPDPESPVSDR